MSRITVFKGNEKMSYMDIAMDLNKSVAYIQSSIYKFLAKKEVSKDMQEYLSSLKIVDEKVELTQEERKRKKQDIENAKARARRRFARECRFVKTQVSIENQKQKQEEKRQNKAILGNRVKEIERQLKKKYTHTLTPQEVMFECQIDGRELGRIYMTNKLPDYSISSVAQYYVKYIEVE